MKRLTLLLGAAALLSTSACVPREEPVTKAAVHESAPLPPGTYPVQSISYDDASGLYSMFLLDTPPGVPPMYQTQNLRMARMSDEEVSAGKQPQVVVDENGPVAMLRPDTQIAYTH